MKTRSPYRLMTEEEKTARRNIRKEEKRLADYEARNKEEREQRPVKSITIKIEWKKSRMWGTNPHATAHVAFHGGGFEHADGFTCSGCGYDKKSTVVAEIFNRFLLYKLWAMDAGKLKLTAPYGIRASDAGTTDQYKGPGYRSFEGGIGISCYAAISAFIGGRWTDVAWGDSFDVFTYEDGATDEKSAA